MTDKKDKRTRPAEPDPPPKVAFDPDPLPPLRAELIERCKKAGIECTARPDVEENTFQIQLQAGREKRPVVVFGPGGLRAFLALPFESIAPVANYAAICSYSEDYIEAEVNVLGRGIGTTSLFYRQLLNLDLETEDDVVSPLVIAGPPGSGVQVAIGQGSEALAVIGSGFGSKQRRPAIRIDGAGAKTNEAASQILERVANAIFFQIDTLRGVALALARRRATPRTPRRRRIAGEPAEILFPRTEFDRDPIQLYWYARSAAGMPLLEFLAYYQAIEFYFPTYSRSEARRNIRNVLKDPAFRPDRDADVGRVLLAAQTTGAGYGTEQTQLRATLQECLEPGALRAFVSETKDRIEHLSKRVEGLTERKVGIGPPDADLRNDVADRIYDIRCKIVHTKSGGRDGNVELLLPFSPQADLLFTDIELVQYVARQVLVAASSPLQLGQDRSAAQPRLAPDDSRGSAAGSRR